MLTGERKMNQTQHYITGISHRLHALIQQLEELSHLDFPSNSPIVLSEILKRILLRLFNDLSDLNSSIDQSPSQDIFEKAKTINFAIIFIGKLTESIHGAQISSTSLPMSSIIEAFEDICGQIAYSTKVIIYPQWDLNATFFDVIPQLKKLSKYINKGDTVEIFRGEPSHIPIITFPTIEGKNYLRQSILAHEVGHFADATYSFSENIIRKCKDVVIKRNESQLMSPKSRKIAIGVIETWIPEIVADVIGLNIVGPAYIFAFDDVMHIPPSLANPFLSQTHPPFGLRAKLTAEYCLDSLIQPLLLAEELRELEENGVHSLNFLKSWLEYLGQQNGTDVTFSGLELPEKEQKAVFSVGKNALELGVNFMHQEMENLGAKDWICTYDDIKDAIKLQVYLDNGLPPSELSFQNNEIKRYPTFAAIMNSGWIYFFRNENKYSYFDENTSFLEPGEVFEKYLKVQKLIAKAVENYLFRKEYMKRRGKCNE